MPEFARGCKGTAETLLGTAPKPEACREQPPQAQPSKSKKGALGSCTAWPEPHKDPQGPGLLYPLHIVGCSSSQGTAGQDGTAHGDISEYRASCVCWITKPGTASPQAASLWDSAPCACPELLQPPHLPATDGGALRGQGPEAQRPGTSPKPAEHPGERGKGALTSSSQHSQARLQGDITQRHEDPKIKETNSIEWPSKVALALLLLLPSWLTFLRPGLCQLLGTNTNACTKNPQKAAKSHGAAKGSDPSKHSAVLQEG